jgi:hypothetical protein
MKKIRLKMLAKKKARVNGERDKCRERKRGSVKEAQEINEHEHKKKSYDKPLNESDIHRVESTNSRM